jgi:chromosome segregation ATPase
MDSELDYVQNHINDIVTATASAIKALGVARKELDDLTAEITHLESCIDDADVEIALYKRFIEQNKELWTAFQVAERIS